MNEINECSIVVLFRAVKITYDAFPAKTPHKQTQTGICTLCSGVVTRT